MGTPELEFDIVIIGAGVIGLAAAERFSRSPSHSYRILVIEKNERIASECTARNSEVIHAGLYYERGSLKEELCILGNAKVYEFCEKNSVPFRRSGKLIVGTQKDDLPALEEIVKTATRANVPLKRLNQREVTKVESNIFALTALECPSTGIVDSETFCQRLKSIAESNGALIQNNCLLTKFEKTSRGFKLTLMQKDGSVFSAKCNQVVNAAGWSAHKIAEPILGVDESSSVKFVRGHYFSLGTKYQNVTKRLIYPIPDKKGGGLGIHLTLDINGFARLGPDADWSNPESVDLRFHDEKIVHLKNKFLHAVQTYLPKLSLDDLSPGFVGVRPKRVAKDGAMLDFYIKEEASRGYEGWVNVLGIESPGLTASLAIADKLAKLLNIE